LSNLRNTQHKTVFDIGAGYGRITAFLSAKFNQVESIEIEAEMYKVLKIRSRQFNNCNSQNLDYKAYKYSKYSEECMFIFAQNTFGTLNQSMETFTSFLNLILKKGDELVITFFTAKSLASIGQSVYKSLEEMVGKINHEKSDFRSGDFVSETNYYSKWVTEKELCFFIENINHKSILQDIEGSFYKIIHFKI